MKIFIIVIGVAGVIGGFVIGGLTGGTFSLFGAVASGIGLAIGLLLLGAYFNAQEKKKKEILPSEIRDVFDRLTGKMSSLSASTLSHSGWIPRPFSKNKSKEEFKEWFANVEPWSGVDPRIIDALIDRLQGNPMFEVFVHTSLDNNLLPHYIPLSALFDKEAGLIAIYPHIAKILFNLGNVNYEAMARIVEGRPIDEKALKAHYKRALDAYESSIHVEPDFISSYFQLALLKLKIQRADDARNFCFQGLKRLEKIKQAPFQKSELPDIRKAGDWRGEMEAQFRTLLEAINQAVGSNNHAPKDKISRELIYEVIMFFIDKAEIADGASKLITQQLNAKRLAREEEEVVRAAVDFYKTKAALIKNKDPKLEIEFIDIAAQLHEVICKAVERPLF